MEILGTEYTSWITHLRYLEVQSNAFHFHFNYHQAMINKKTNNYHTENLSNIKEKSLYGTNQNEVLDEIPQLSNYHDTPLSTNHFLCSLSVSDKNTLDCKAFPIESPGDDHRISCSSKNHDIELTVLNCVYIDSNGASQYLYDHKQNVMIKYPETITPNVDSDYDHKIIAIEYKDENGASGLMYNTGNQNTTPYFLSFGKGMGIARSINARSVTTYKGRNALVVNLNKEKYGLEFLTFSWKLEVSNSYTDLTSNINTSISIGGSKGSPDGIDYTLVINQNFTIMSNPNSYLQP